MQVVNYAKMESKHLAIILQWTPSGLGGPRQVATFSSHTIYFLITFFSAMLHYVSTVL